MHAQPPWLPGPLGSQQVCRFFTRFGLGTSGTVREHLHVGANDEQVVQPGQVCILLHAEVYAQTPLADIASGSWTYEGSYFYIQRRNGERTCNLPCGFGTIDNDAQNNALGQTLNGIGRLNCAPILAPIVLKEGDRADIYLVNATNPRTDFRVYVTGIVLPVVNDVPGLHRFFTEQL